MALRGSAKGEPSPPRTQHVVVIGTCEPLRFLAHSLPLQVYAEEAAMRNPRDATANTQEERQVYERRIEQLERHVERVMSILKKPTPDVNLSVSTASQTTQPPQPSLNLPASYPPADVISENLITFGEAEVLLNEYRNELAENFPYIILPESTSLSSLRQASPMLLLAILVTASWKNQGQQEVLNDAYLRLMSSKLIIEGRKDLDLLQGLMVYLTWIHLHYVPKTQQVYRLVSIAAAIAVDIGITRRPGKGQHQQMTVENTVVVPTGLTALNSEFWNREAQRAYLGCYHMSTWYSVLTRKTSFLPYNDYMLACARSLASAKEVPSDAELIYKMEFTREAERVYSMFNYSETNQLQNMSEEHMQVYLNTFSAEINEWRARLPSSMVEDPGAQLWPKIFGAFVREIGLHGISRNLELSVSRIAILLDSLTHAKSYLDTFLTIPVDRLAGFTSTQWTLLHYSMLLVTNISLVAQTPVWNIETARSIIKLEMYIDVVSIRLRELSSRITPVEGRSNWYGGLLLRWEAMRTRYLMGLQQRQQPEMDTQSSPVQTGGSQTMGVLSYQTLTPHVWLGPYPYQATDGGFIPAPGFELLDFESNFGSWVLSNGTPSLPETVHF
ncbi:uncharacterized protein Z518_05291 [Rhinocladiella mackenziei CBS 650.93]|uniref:Xylanolytic transcriptional activator regulatory domain-containing protein n=1 Tax=Rhinocladiella mackenziei CBS 650.93 TaxID=1442369 RepID=A0A0D2H1W5_9EURO|nr:uncharacterized protein Z518_05291 [Rhinocladiella mackenziei CBS 650.93]KIX04423.1 hypothetical protein Z518_05291 [Rhinocladiella mackenziei CBS 650.93]